VLSPILVARLPGATVTPIVTPTGQLAYTDNSPNERRVRRRDSVGREYRPFRLDRRHADQLRLARHGNDGAHEPRKRIGQRRGARYHKTGPATISGIAYGTQTIDLVAQYVTASLTTAWGDGRQRRRARNRQRGTTPTRNDPGGTT